ncbi:DUF2339 domain-containing protein [Alkalihalobacillus pseudalcaliphilus]|uniref:DUF2339 domain-containing protein n=1 Tax=Alkalihalobacillus pseudalcaliphilus TaxID=79884 RepID=UPI00064DBAE9|nr:DUF2339 domain-containing protein [Alkalihalobacillus pseudalcaliphilus]KMK75884.1 hypothetical protein AB990_11525 [Alkalihalobacillus pseudalcaliphilus]
MSEHRIDQLEKRIEELEGEVRVLKRQVHDTAKSGNVDFLSVHEQQVHKEEPAPVLEPANMNSHKRPLQTDSQKHPNKELDLEKLIGRVWLPRIFLFVLLVGVIWGFKVVIDYGILTESVRVILGFLLAICLLFIGEWQIKHQRHALGKTLLVGAISILIFTTFAMQLFYHMMTSYPSFGLNIAWVVLGLFLAHRHQSEIIGILMAIVGYLIPFFSFGLAVNLVPIIYVSVFYVLLTCFAVLKNYRSLFYLASGLLHIVYLNFFIFASVNEFMDIYLFIAIGAIVQQALIAFTIIQEKWEKSWPIPLLFTSFLLTTIWVKVGSTQIEWLFDAYLLFIMGASLWLFFNKNRQKSSSQNRQLASVSLAVVTIALFILFVNRLPENTNALAILLMGQGLVGLTLGRHLRYVFQQVAGLFVFSIGVILTLLTPIYSMVSFEFVVWCLMLLSLYGLLWIAKHKYTGHFSVIKVAFVALVIGHLLFMFQLPYYQVFGFAFVMLCALAASLLGIYYWVRGLLKNEPALMISFGAVHVLIHLFLLSDFVKIAMTSIGASNMTTMLISFAWAIYAAGSIIIGTIRKKRVFRLLGLGLLFMTLVKVVFIDLNYLTITTRSILFIGLGLIGLLLSRLFYEKKTTEEPDEFVS